MIKNVKKILLILILIFMMTMTAHKSYADFLAEYSFKKNQYSHNIDATIGEQMRIGLPDLMSSANWNMLCNAHGQPLTSGKADFYVKAIETCTPEQAYVLSQMKEGVNSYGEPDNYNEIQKAWYNLKGTEGISENTLANTAKAYQKFVAKITNGNVSDPSTYVDTKNKATGETIKFPAIKEEKDLLAFNVLDESGNLTGEKATKLENNIKVEFKEDTQKYIIGPISINYVEQSANGVDFGALCGFDIYTDASNEAVPKDKWRFIWKTTHNDEFEYPHSDDVFNIELDYIEGATMITGMDIDYKYLIAGGTYEILEGKLHDGILPKDQQELVLANRAARWYETVKIHKSTKPEDSDDHEGSLIIRKIALDENGREMTADEVKDKFSGANQYFTFSVRLTYADGKNETLFTRVRAGEAVKVGPISWKGDTAPTYEVHEILPENEAWKFVDMTDNRNGSLITNQTIEITARNQINKRHSNKIRLMKAITDVADHDEVFEFKITVTYPDGKIEEEILPIVVAKGTLTSENYSKEYVWYGDEVPSYEVVELETADSKLYPNRYITPATGKLDGSTVQLDVQASNNKDIEHVGFLTIEKTLMNGQVTNDTFDFRVTVNGVSTTPNGVQSFDVLGVKAGEKKGPYAFIWKGDVAPTFVVEEINVNNAAAKVNKIEATVVDKDGKVQNAGEQKGNSIVGRLVADGEANVSAKFTNDMTKHSGGLRIEKDIETTEKISKDTLASNGTKFDVEVVISGTFVHNGKTYENSTEVIKKSLPEDGKWSFEVSDVVWYGSKAPTFTVRETNLPKGWRLKGITYSDVVDETSSKEGHSLIDGKVIDAKIINELPVITLIDLTFSMSGVVWIDETLDNKNQDPYYNAPNGVYDEGDTPKENAEVTIYRVVYDASGKEVSRELAKAYKDTSNNEVTYPIITKSDGRWDVPRIPVPTVSPDEKGNGYTARYDVEFVYDGQTYEPTEFLAYQIKGNNKIKNTGSNAEKAAAYKNAKTSVKDRYAKDSMALATPENANNVITNVAGKTQIDANGDSTGTATLADGRQVDLKYHADNAGDEYPVRSSLITTADNGLVADIFRATARTSVGDLTFPFDVDGYDGSSLTNVDKIITDSGIQEKYKFIAVYNYCLNINLGLKRRTTADVALSKTLDNAKVVVKEKLYQYNYSGHFDLTEEKLNSLDKDIKVTGENVGETIEYALGLYRSDYYYRAEMYKTGTDKGIYDKLETFYKALPNVNNKTVKDTQMDIYLTYKIKLSNSSSAYDVKINSIDDYYDSSFELVREDVTKYLKTQTVGGKETDINGELKVAEATKENWETTKTGLVGADKDKNDTNIRYNKMTLNNANITLAPGEQKELIVTFKVKKDKDKTYNIDDSVILGLKCNVAEIASYTTYNTGTSNVAGKVDRDSAPGNVAIATNNSKKWYEDDTFAAPQLNINLVAENQDRTVNGVAWEDNSKDTNTENPGYNQQVGNGIKEDNEVGIKGLTTQFVEKVMVPDTAGNYTEYDYIWPTAETLDCLNGKTLEEVTGGFSSRITTQDEGKYTFNNVPSGDYVVRFVYGDDFANKIESADYSTAKYYNGQDYKSTTLKAYVKGGTPDKYVRADSYLDIDATNKNAEIKNTAIDSEVRRLQVVEKSRTIDYNNGVVMAEYQEDLFKDYYMFADTLKLDMNIEFSGYGEAGYNYNIKNVNFGLEERPITQITLDKQIEEIMLTTSDGKTIMDAKYNINYAVDDKGEVTATVELDTANSYGIENLQALNRDLATNQGFRYINIDFDILEGTTISVKYRFTAINTGEVDRTGWLADSSYNWDNDGFYPVCNSLATELATYKKEGNSLKNDNLIGHYVGSIYYLGAAGDPADSVVTSRVRQLVDYIDNDVTFDGKLNAVANMSWSNAEIDELRNHIDPSMIQNIDGVDTIVDENGISYKTDRRNNLVLSVDNDKTSDTIHNGEFIVHLTPYVAATSTGAPYSSSMSLLVTKYVSADADDLQIDNVAEIIRYENIVGRRDELTIPGNQNPASALETEINTETTVSAGMKYERDTSATEVITLSPPTGSSLTVWKMQVVATTAIGLVILCGGIIWIKKKVLK